VCPHRLRQAACPQPDLRYLCLRGLADSTCPPSPLSRLAGCPPPRSRACRRLTSMPIPPSPPHPLATPDPLDPPSLCPSLSFPWPPTGSPLQSPPTSVRRPNCAHACPHLLLLALSLTHLLLSLLFKPPLVFSPVPACHPLLLLSSRSVLGSHPNPMSMGWSRKGGHVSQRSRKVTPLPRRIAMTAAISGWQAGAGV
jgi:hypothetical protein